MKTKNRPRNLSWLLLAFLATAPDASAFYNPNSGRWFSRDPIGERGGINLYLAFKNDPLSFIDSLGLQSCVNNPSGNLSVPTRGIPKGPAGIAYTGQQMVRKKLSISIKVIAPDGKGGGDDGDIGPIPTGLEGWEYMSDREKPNLSCIRKYKCIQECECMTKAFSVEWTEGKGWVAGKTTSTPVLGPNYTHATDSQGNELYMNATCVPHASSEQAAIAACRKSSKDRCNTVVRLGNCK